MNQLSTSIYPPRILSVLTTYSEAHFSFIILHQQHPRHHHHHRLSHLIKNFNENEIQLIISILHKNKRRLRISSVSYKEKAPLVVMIIIHEKCLLLFCFALNYL